MVKFLKILASGAALLLAMLYLAYLFLPWKGWAEEIIREKISQQGIPLKSLTVQEVALTHIDFSDVELRMESPITLPFLRVHYDLSTVLEQGRLDHVELRNLDYRFSSTNSEEVATEATSQAYLPTPDILMQIPVSTITVTDSLLRWESGGSRLQLPFSAEIIPNADSPITLRGVRAEFSQADGGQVTLQNWQFSASPDGQHWSLELSADRADITLGVGKSKATKLNLPLPTQLQALPVRSLKLAELPVTLQSAGESVHSTIRAEATFQPEPTANITFKNNQLQQGETSYRTTKATLTLNPIKAGWRLKASAQPITGTKDTKTLWLPLRLTASGTAKQHALSFDIQAEHKDFTASGVVHTDGVAVTAEKLRTKLASGTIQVDRVNVSKKPIRATLRFDNIALEELLQLLLQDERSVQATGRLTGTLPLAWEKGALMIGSGELHSTTHGILSLGDQHLTALPQGVEQVNQVRELLKRFEYHTLSLTTEEKNGKLTVKTALKGRNPNVYRGAEVHLNVNLQGDILETIRSTLGLYELPAQYLPGKLRKD